MLRNDPAFEIGRTAGRIVDDHRDRLALVELCVCAARRDRREQRKQPKCRQHGTWHQCPSLGCALPVRWHPTTLLRRALFLRALIGQQRAQLERLEGRPVRLLVEELPQARIVGVFLVASLDGLALGGEVVVGLGHVHRPDLTDGVLGGAQNRRALLHQPLGQIDHGVLQLLGRDGEVDHADPRGFLAVERIPEAGVVELSLIHI